MIHDMIVILCGTGRASRAGGGRRGLRHGPLRTQSVTARRAGRGDGGWDSCGGAQAQTNARGAARDPCRNAMLAPPMMRALPEDGVNAHAKRFRGVGLATDLGSLKNPIPLRHRRPQGGQAAFSKLIGSGGRSRADRSD